MLFSRSLNGIRSRPCAAPLTRASLAALSVALLAAPAVLAAPGGPSGDGVQPVETLGNPDCVSVLGVGAKELKDDSPSDGNQTDGTLSVSVDVRNTADGQVFDFTGATRAINAVIVKAGDNANVYTYPFGDTADTGLHGPVNTSNGRFHDLSHISFCYDAPPPCTPPAITTDPPDQLGVTYGTASVTFTAAASGSGPPTVQWQYSPTGAPGTFTAIAGETANSLTITAPEVADSGTYRAVYTNSCGTANADAALTVTPKALTGTCTVANKVYDGTTTATITGSQLDAGVVPGDDVTLNASSASSAFADPDVGNGKPTPCDGFSLSGADASNYTLTMSPTTADITPRPITGSCTVADKVYDGTTAATITGSALSGVVGGDDVSLDTAGANSAFGDPDVGSDKATPCNGFALSGPDAGNYTLAMSPTTADITPKPVLVTCSVADKQFDGTTSATITGAVLSGAVAGDDVGVAGGSATFDDPRPGVDKPVTCTGFTLVGADKDNYLLAIANPQATIQRPPAPAPGPTCLRRNIFAFVRTGNDAKRVVFFLDGERFADVRKRDRRGRFGVHIQRRELGPGKHVLSATVFFKTGRRPVKLIVFRFKPCLGSDVAREISVTNLGAGCVRRSFVAFVTGDTISTVAFSLNGRRLRTISIADGKGRYKVLISPSQLRPGRNVLRATIRYIRSSRTRAVTLKKTIRSC